MRIFFFRKNCIIGGFPFPADVVNVVGNEVGHALFPNNLARVSNGYRYPLDMRLKKSLKSNNISSCRIASFTFNSREKGI